MITASTRVANIREVGQFARFIFVGGTGTLVNLGLLFLLPRFEVTIAVAAAIAIEVSILWNFTWNDRWTFATFVRLGRELTWWQRCWRYHLIVAVGSLLNYGAILVLAESIDVLPAGVAGIALASLWNYGANRFTVYKGKL